MILNSSHIKFNKLPQHVCKFLSALNKHAPSAYAFMVNDCGSVNKDILLSYYERISEYGDLQITNDFCGTKIFKFVRSNESDQLFNEWIYTDDRR